MALVKCPGCGMMVLPRPSDAWCQEHGPIPLPNEKPAG